MYDVVSSNLKWPLPGNQNSYFSKANVSITLSYHRMLTGQVASYRIMPCLMKASDLLAQISILQYSSKSIYISKMVPDSAIVTIELMMGNSMHSIE